MIRPMLHTALLAVAAMFTLATSALAYTARSADEIVSEVRRATAKYQDIARARADGYVQFSGMEARHGYHFMDVDSELLTATGLAGGTVDLRRPPVLLYVERDGVWTLAGVEYALASRPAVNPFPGADWHEHEASCHYRDYREIAARRAGECPPSHPQSGEPFVIWHPAFAVAHVWAWIPSPDGPFSEENRALAAYGGIAADPGHRHPRSATELAYSQITHRIAGSVLLLLAGVIAWESWRPRRFPWSAPSSAIWILFGLYLVPTCDPESWPWGPKRFVEIFSDPLVLQHKIMALIPIAIGISGALRSAGLMPRARWAALVAVLAALGGASLFVHFHDGRFHIDAIYLQHVAMGTAALGVGVVLFLAGREVRATRRGQALLHWAWPGLLAVMALVLLFYVEA